MNADAETRTLIVLDDEPMMIASLRRRLKAEGYDQYIVKGFTRARDALCELEKGECFVFISDLMMPDITGDKVVEYIQEKYPAQRCIVITAYAERGMISRIVNLGNTVDVLAKPLIIERLVSTLDRLANQSTTTSV
ncbi:response regulator [Pontibacterium sp.]|uniref:response regulator n=1 Tax=Pontibacterium sp. TaxID=2036026 RepID=UPI0035646BA4